MEITACYQQNTDLKQNTIMYCASSEDGKSWTWMIPSLEAEDSRLTKDRLEYYKLCISMPVVEMLLITCWNGDKVPD